MHSFSLKNRAELLLLEISAFRGCCILIGMTVFLAIPALISLLPSDAQAFRLSCAVQYFLPPELLFLEAKRLEIWVHEDREEALHASAPKYSGGKSLLLSEVMICVGIAPPFLAAEAFGFAGKWEYLRFVSLTFGMAALLYAASLALRSASWAFSLLMVYHWGSIIFSVLPSLRRYCLMSPYRVADPELFFERYFWLLLGGILLIFFIDKKEKAAYNISLRGYK